MSTGPIHVLTPQTWLTRAKGLPMTPTTPTPPTTLSERIDMRKWKEMAEAWTKDTTREEAVNESTMGFYLLDAIAEVTGLREASEFLRVYAQLQVERHPNGTDAPNWRRFLAALEDKPIPPVVPTLGTITP